MKLCFATNNAHKLHEISLLLPASFVLVSLDQIGCHEELAETQDTIEGNSRQKAEYVWEQYGVQCFADDTGLEVAALNNEPGVYSARYAGSQRNSEDNIDLLLKNLADKPDRLTLPRGAQFKTVITLVLGDITHQFEGIVKGEILRGRRGKGGFGYDSVFLPEGYNHTFAEMNTEEKGRISHRGRAFEKLLAFLKSQ
ncbi:MAG: RdgB/HAM1 family non-canonical purine NTP pyrophosphatase [Bacteroidota bacterium]